MGRQLQIALMPDTTGELRSALLQYRDKYGHFPNCLHNFHATGHETHTAGFDCPDNTCRGSGQGCSAKCQQSQRALEAAS